MVERVSVPCLRHPCNLWIVRFDFRSDPQISQITQMGSLLAVRPCVRGARGGQVFALDAETHLLWPGVRVSIEVARVNQLAVTRTRPGVFACDREIVIRTSQPSALRKRNIRSLENPSSRPFNNADTLG